jgi:uncharacterized protein
MGRPVVHWEFWSRNPQGVADFYKTVFDWEIQHIPEMNYRLAKTGEGGIGGGIFEPKEGPIPAPTSIYIDVDELDAYGRKVVAAGGQIVVDKQEVPGMGSFSLFSDPEGRVVGMWKAT